MILHQAHVIDRLRYYGYNPEKCQSYWAHTPRPPITDEPALDTWMDRMNRTHKQIQCPDCGLYAIYIPRGNDMENAQEDDGE